MMPLITEAYDMGPVPIHTLADLATWERVTARKSKCARLSQVWKMAKLSAVNAH